MDELLEHLEEQGYEQGDIEQLLKDMESYKKVPDEFRDTNSHWQFDDNLEYECKIDDKIRIWKIISEAPDDYKLPFGIESTVTGGSVDGTGILFKSVNGEVDCIIVYDSDYVEILYNIELVTEESKPEENEATDKSA